MSGGGVMDAFVIAFRIPNLFRRLFGEGALAASYLPVLTAQLEKDRSAAWQLVSVGLTWLAVILAGVLLIAEGLFALVWVAWGDVPGVALLVGLAAVLMPYVLFICLAAQVAATLHALSHFSIPSLARGRVSPGAGVGTEVTEGSGGGASGPQPSSRAMASSSGHRRCSAEDRH